MGDAVPIIARRIAETAAALEGIERVREVRHLEPATVAALMETFPARTVEKNRKIPIPEFSPVGNVDAIVRPSESGAPLVAIELKWCYVDKLYEGIWDLFKMALLATTRAQTYLLTGAPSALWESSVGRELFDDGLHSPERLCELRLPWGQKLRAWDDLLWGGHDKYPKHVPSMIRTTVVGRAAVDENGAWEIRVVQVTPAGSSLTAFEDGWPFPRPMDAVRPLGRGIRCPECGTVLEERGQLGIVPHTWEELAYRCDSCGVGYSNSVDPTSRRVIVRSPDRNVPEEARQGVVDVLNHAVNERNRASKRWKFCSSASEDALTWAAVQALRQSGQLAQLVPPDLVPADEEPSVLLWGVPVAGPDAPSLADRLARISSELGERPTARTEPDVILSWDGVLAVVEAKLASRNDLKPPGHRGWQLYYSRSCFDASFEAVAATGLYELARNWRIGFELAGERSFVLVNLAPVALDADAVVLQRVTAETPMRRFATRTWREVLAGAPAWVCEFAVERGGMPPPTDVDHGATS